jgi:uncharacterized membrane protein YqjE
MIIETETLAGDNEAEEEVPTLTSLTHKTLGTTLGALENRMELFMIEVQEEKSRAITLIIVGIGALFLATMTLLLLTGAIIFLVPEEYRLYAVAGFLVLYLGGTIAAILNLKTLLKQVPFGESLNQIKKDSELLDAFK